MSTSTGTLAHSSMAYRPIRPACSEVPHATTTILRRPREELIVDRAEITEVDAGLASRPLAYRLRNGVCLLMNLLEHERFVTLLFGRVGIPVDLDHVALDTDAVGR